jgi:hydrogenase maturation protease
VSRTLVAGIGNIFMGDDAFGYEVVRQLSADPLPEGVVAVDFGIRSYDLAFAIMDGYDRVILVDIAARGEPPGTVFLIQPDTAGAEGVPQPVSVGHGMDPVSVLRLVETLGGTTARLLLVGCEPYSFSNDDTDITLSEPVRSAVPRALDMIRSIIQREETP